MKKIFVLGDSISLDYGYYLEQILFDDYLFDRKGYEYYGILRDQSNSLVNGGNSEEGKLYLQKIDKKRIKGSIMLLNFGLHDIKRSRNDNTLSISKEKYSNNLEQIINYLKDLNVNVFWCRTTPVDNIVHNSRFGEFYRFNKDVIDFNISADIIMKDNGISIIDLYGFTLSLGSNLYKDHIHFKNEISKMQAAYIAGAICSKESNYS